MIKRLINAILIAFSLVVSVSALEFKQDTRQIVVNGQVIVNGQWVLADSVRK